jgi:L-lactate utilization protein LutC
MFIKHILKYFVVVRNYIHNKSEEIGMKEEKFEKLVENFKLRNIEVECFESLEAVKSYILDIVPIKSTIGIGHSATLQKMNITKSLLERGNVVYDKELAKNRDECKELKRKALTTDWYITGSNAISVDGRIVNVDHSGNRIASITFGPDKVIIVVGKNKIVNSVDEAIKRVKNVACPLNAKRAGFNPPCVTLNRCVDCISKERVCNSLSIIEGQSECDRIRVVIVNEECGF